MNEWRRAQLGDFVDILSGYPFASEGFGDDGDLPVVRIRDVVAGQSKTFFRGDYDDRYVVRDGDILIGMDGEFNRARWRSGPALLNQRVCRVSSSSSGLDEGYLYHFLPHALREIEAATPFVTVRHLSTKDIRAITLPLPPAREQRRIAAILDKADALRAKRRAALAQLDALTRSIFLDMVGDPATNPKGWLKVPVSAYVKAFQGGKSFESEANDNRVTTNRVLKVSAVTSGRFDSAKSKPVPDYYMPPPGHFVRIGDLLFSRANTSELVGAVAYIDHAPDNLLLPDKLWRFVWAKPEEIEPLFVWSLFQTPAVRREIERRSTGTSGSMKNISQEKLLGIQTILPPFELQRQFADAFRRVSKMRRSQMHSELFLNALFTSLQHRAFRGEL